MISIAAPIIEAEEKQAVNDVIDSGMLAQGHKVAELEKNFAEYCGTKYAVALNSGTASIHAGLYALGVKPGDEVITTPYSFIATINPILMLGATPLLVDIDEETFNLDPSKVEAAITDKTRVIVPVHLYGQPADWHELRAIAERNNVKLLEDACQAVGAVYGDRKTGSLGEAGCFSLYATKNIMCGEGGMLTTDDEHIDKAVRAFRQHGMIAPYEYADIGYNYRLTDLQAAIAVEQLKKADTFNQARQKNAEELTELLRDCKGIKLPAVKSGRSHVFHQYTIVLDKDLNRDVFVTALNKRGVGTGIYYPKPLHSYPHIQKLGYKLGDFPIAELLAARVVSLPIHPKVTESEIKTIAEAVKEAVHA